MRRRFKGHAARERQVAALMDEMQRSNFRPNADFLGQLIDFIQGRLRAAQVTDLLRRAGHVGPVSLSLRDAHNTRDPVIRRTYPEVNRAPLPGVDVAPLPTGLLVGGHSAIPLNDEEGAQGLKAGANAEIARPPFELFHVQVDGMDGEPELVCLFRRLL